MAILGPLEPHMAISRALELNMAISRALELNMAIWVPLEAQYGPYEAIWDPNMAHMRLSGTLIWTLVGRAQVHLPPVPPPCTRRCHHHADAHWVPLSKADGVPKPRV